MLNLSSPGTGLGYPSPRFYSLYKPIILIAWYFSPLAFLATAPCSTHSVCPLPLYTNPCSVGQSRSAWTLPGASAYVPPHINSKLSPPPYLTAVISSSIFLFFFHPQTTYSQHYTQEGKLTEYFLNSGVKQEHSVFPVLFNIVLEVLSTAIRQETQMPNVFFHMCILVSKM